MITKPEIEIDLQKVESLAERGLTKEQIADALGISESTLYQRQRESEEFAYAIKRGKAKGIGFVSNQLMTKIKEGNVVSMIFFLKAQAGWREVNQTEISGIDGGAIEHRHQVIERVIIDSLSDGGGE